MNTVKRMKAWDAWEYGMEVRVGFLEEVLVMNTSPLKWYANYSAGEHFPGPMTSTRFSKGKDHLLKVSLSHSLSHPSTHLHTVGLLPQQSGAIKKVPLSTWL